MRQRPGYTLVELITVMAIFMIATGIVVADFRQNNEREYLKGAAVDVVNLLSTMQGWSLGNKNHAACQPPTCRVMMYGIYLDPGQQPQFYFTTEEEPNELVVIPESIQLPRNVSVMRVRKDQDRATCIPAPPADHCGEQNVTFIHVGFRIPDGRPAVSDVSPSGVVSGSAFIYLQNAKLVQKPCRRVSVLASGLITQDEATCPT